MNINNAIATTVLSCNNNITTSNKVYLFYVTLLYQTNHNQKEEMYTYHNICQCIKIQQDMLAEQHDDGIYVTKEISKGFRVKV